MQSIANTMFLALAPVLTFAVLIGCGSSANGTGVTNTQAPAAAPVCAMNGEDCRTNDECCSHVCGAGSCAGTPNR